MNFNITLLAEAEFDIQEAELYYDEISRKLTGDFFDELYTTLEYIQLEPHIYQVRYRDIRIALLHRFPYGIHYLVTNYEIFIIRVLHTSRYFR